MKLTYKLTLCFSVFALFVWLLGYVTVNVKRNEIRETFAEHAGMPAYEVLYEMDSQQVLIVCTGATVLAVLMSISTYFVISGPLKRLMDAANRIGKGNLDVDIDIDSRDEIGQLAQSIKNMIEDLKKVTVRRDELEKEVAERRKAEYNMLQSRVEWENTFNTIPDMITIHDRNHNIIRANTTAKEMLKLPKIEKDSAIKCYKYYHGNGGPPDECMSCRTFETREPCTFEMYEKYLDKFVEVRAMPMYDSRGEFGGVIHIVRDITGTKKAEDKIQDQFRRLNALHSVEKTINSTFDLNVILDILLDQILLLLNIDAAAVLLYNQHLNVLEYTFSKGFSSHALKYTKLRLGESNAGLAAMERRIVSIPDLRESSTGFEKSEHLSDENFISYLAVPLIAKGQLKGVLELFHRSMLRSNPEWMEFLETIANQAAVAIDNAALFDGLQRSNIELTMAYDSTIEGWARALDMRDKETEGHSRRVTEMTIQAAAALGIKEDEIIHIRRGALLHDIGKMGIPDNILLKPGKLTENEWDIMRLHPVYAHEMLYPIKYLRPAIEIPYCHHEKWDGTGYPRGLAKDEIPVSARIFAMVDVWDALSSDRPYRPAWSRERVSEYILSQSGTHFDPEIVDIFVDMDWSHIYHPDQEK